ncbi:MAG: hypothetical protein DRJ44_03890 [Thermoprotei archaeon]|nr:MAG: hypothetical protein DRJ44_03890 [Thermoprotei archaeon]
MNYLSIPFSRKHADLIDVSTPHSTADIADSAITSAKLSFATYEKIYETTLSSNVTSITITGLDINSDKQYKLIINLKNGAGSGLFRIYVNNDTTATNYYEQRLLANDTTVTANRINDCYIDGVTVEAYVEIDIIRTNDGYILMFVKNSLNRGSSVYTGVRAISTAGTHTNLTQIDLVGSTSGLFGAGTRIMLFKISK